MTKEAIDEYKENFSKHQIFTIHSNDQVQVFLFRKPDSWSNGFQLVCTDNTILMNGDCWSLLIEPGYGRSGLAFLRGSVFDVSYFLSKCPFRDEVKEFSRERALENIEYYHENEYLTDDQYEDFIERFTDKGEFYDIVSYYELCHEYEIDEPMGVKVLKHRTLNQIAGLQCFVREYEKMISLQNPSEVNQ